MSIAEISRSEEFGQKSSFFDSPLFTWRSLVKLSSALLTNQGDLIKAKFIGWCSIIIFAACYQTLSILPRYHFVDFLQLQWKTSKGTEVGEVTQDLPAPSTGAIVDGTQAVRLSSEAFHPKAPIVELEYLVPKDLGDLTALVRVINNDGLELYRQRLPLKHTKGWSKIKLTGFHAEPSQAIRIEIRTKTLVPKSAFTIRDRSNFYFSTDIGLARIDSIYLRYGLCVILTVFFACAVNYLILQAPTTGRLLVGLILVALAVHFRATSYFHWDEWNTLERFRVSGIKSVLDSHNEHFLPIFFGWYYLQVVVFGNCYQTYLLVSILIHSLNCFLVIRLLEHILPSQTPNSKVPRILGVIFLASALHAESLHWAFEQSLLLSQFCNLCSFLLFLNYLREKKFRILLNSLLLLAVSPLLFGNGFIAVVQVFLFGLLKIVQDRNQFSFKSLCMAAPFSALAIAIPAALYYLNRTPSGHAVTESSLAENLTPFFDYLFVGIFLGAVLRAFSFYPTLELGAAAPLIAEFYKITGYEWIRVFHPPIIFATIGCCVTLTTLSFLGYRKDRISFLSIWIVGLLIIVTSLLLPAIGRWSFGSIQSLALRYHYSTLLGVIMLVLPITVHIASKPKRSVAFIFGSLFLLFQTATQLWLGLEFKYFSGQGATHREYFESLVQWKATSTDQKSIPDLNQKLYPLLPNTLSPNFNAEQIYSIVDWLDAGRFPKLERQELLNTPSTP